MFLSTITSVIWQHRFESYLLSWFDESISQSYIFQESSIVEISYFAVSLEEDDRQVIGHGLGIEHD